MSDRVAIVGPGRVGVALGAALAQRRAVERLVFYGRALEPPPHPLFDPRNPVARYGAGIGALEPDTTVVVLAVPDRVLAEVAHGLAAAAIAAGRRLVSVLGGHALVVPPALRPLYHAAAVFASNYIVAVVSVAARLLVKAGVPEDEAARASLPLLRGAVDNIEHLGFAASLTGPISRGDVDTVRPHLGRLSSHDRSLYSALGRETLRLARLAGLDPARAAELESLLSAD